jgi:hypothetical protein
VAERNREAGPTRSMSARKTLSRAQGRLGRDLAR